jgi:hypothetical protein
VKSARKGFKAFLGRKASQAPLGHKALSALKAKQDL